MCYSIDSLHQKWFNMMLKNFFLANVKSFCSEANRIANETAEVYNIDSTFIDFSTKSIAFILHLSRMQDNTSFWNFVSRAIRIRYLWTSSECNINIPKLRFLWKHKLYLKDRPRWRVAYRCDTHVAQVLTWINKWRNLFIENPIQ